MIALMIAAVAWGLWRFVAGCCWQEREKLLVGLYVMPMYVLAPWWVLVLLSEAEPLRLPCVLVDALVLVLAASRMLSPIVPASGHVLFLLYSLLVSRRLIYRLPAGAVLLVSIAMKFALWRDAWTVAIGAVLAIGLWLLRVRLAASTKS